MKTGDSDDRTFSISGLTGREKQETFFSSPKEDLFFQAKLTVRQTDDAYEQEADAVAEKVMRMPESKGAAPFFLPQPFTLTPVQRKCSHCEEEVKIQMKSEEMSGEMTAPSAVDQALSSPGQPLDSRTRTFMESRFGYDFGNVEIHDDSLANKSSKDIGALAYTHDRHIVFGADQYRPHTDAGKSLLAHELTHVVQQSNVIRRYRDPGDSHSIHFGTENTVDLVEQSFEKKKDRETKPWIELIEVKFTLMLPDKNGKETWQGLGKAKYYNNALKLADIEFPAVAGPEGRGKTRAGNFTVKRIEGVGYNSSSYSAPYERETERGWGRRYAKNLLGNMNYAVFFTPRQALHAGPTDQCSHGCIHVDWSSPQLMQQINYHSVQGWTKVNVTYP